MSGERGGEWREGGREEWREEGRVGEGGKSGERRRLDLRNSVLVDC